MMSDKCNRICTVGVGWVLLSTSVFLVASGCCLPSLWPPSAVSPETVVQPERSDSEPKSTRVLQASVDMEETATSGSRNRVLRPVYLADDEATGAFPHGAFPEEIVAPVAFEIQQLQDVALTNSPALAKALARIDAARGKWVQSGLMPNPNVGYIGDDIGEEGAAGKHGAFVEKRFVRGNKLGLRQMVAAQEVQKAEQIAALVEARIRAEVRLGMIQLVIAARRVVIADELVEIGQKVVRDSTRLFGRGEIKKAELFRAEAEAGSIQVIRQRALTEYFAARRLLATELGVDVNRVPNIETDRITSELAQAVNVRVDRQKALDRLLAESPEVSVQVMEIQRAQWAVRQAMSESASDYDVQLSIQHSDSTHDTQASLQWALPIPIYDWNQGTIRQRRAELRAAHQGLLDVHRQLQRRFELAYQKYLAAKQQVMTYSDPESGIIHKTSEGLRLTRLGFEAEEFSSVEMFAAQRGHANAQLEYLEILSELWVAAIGIDELLMAQSTSD